jgi:hypothetical protein
VGPLPSEKDTRLPYRLHPPRTHTIPAVSRWASEIFKGLLDCRFDKVVSHTGSLLYLRCSMEEI